jgi:hypothetical protein
VIGDHLNDLVLITIDNCTVPIHHTPHLYGAPSSRTSSPPAFNSDTRGPRLRKVQPAHGGNQWG